MSDTSVPANVQRWKVVSQVPQLAPSPTGAMVPGTKVTAQVIASGTTFSVLVPNSQYTAAQVRQLLEQQYEQTAAIDNLGG